jgi:hypothetical protein
MPGAGHSRLGDIGVGVCPCHKSPVGYVTVFISGCPNVNVDGITECTVGTIGAASCGHPTIALTGSGNTISCGQGAHRVGDMGVNCGAYVAVSGSSNTVAG